MSLFPMFLKLADRQCLVVGAGKIGESKIRSLLVAHAKVRVIAPWATPTVTAWARAGLLDWEARTFQADDLNSIFLVVRSEEHTSELQSLRHLVCRLLLEKKKEH